MRFILDFQDYVSCDIVVSTEHLNGDSFVDVI